MPPTNVRVILAQAAALLLLASSGCALTAECRLHGGVPWYEARTPHFVLETNGTENDARRASLMLERFRRAIAVALDLDPDAPGTTEVIVLRDLSSWRTFFSARIGGMAGLAFPRPILVLNAGGVGGTYLPSATVAHELAHELLGRSQVLPARWLNEGTAQYLESIEVADRVSEVRVGAPSGEQLSFLKSTWSFRPFRLNVLRDEFPFVEHGNSHPYYLSSWLWVHFLRNRYPDALQTLRRELLHAQIDSAWLRAFAGRSDDDLYAELIRYTDGGAYAKWTYRVVFPTLRVETRELAPAEIHLLRAGLFEWREAPAAERDRLVRAELETAAMLGPQDDRAQARFIAATHEAESQRRRARDLVARFPRSVEARLTEAAAWRAEERYAEQSNALRTAVADLGEDPRLLRALAQAPLAENDYPGAYNLGRRVLELAPWDTLSLAIVSAAADALGLCAEAWSAYHRSRDGATHAGATPAGEDAIQKPTRCGGSLVPP